MGAKATKFEGSYLPDTPTFANLRTTSNGFCQESISTPERGNSAHIETKDPRSPSGCRTPLNFLAVQTHLPQPVVVTHETNENAFSQLRKRLLKGFALNDPRSPQLNRTPLILDEAIDRTLNMDDTFSDLFVDTRAPNTLPNVISTQKESTNEIELLELNNGSFGTPLAHNNSSVEIVSLPYEEEETMQSNAKLQHTPIQHAKDPRSPSVGVERTPIMFCDDDDEDEMLEQILETLTLNLSCESSMASFVSASAELALDEPQPRPSNKHLERVRRGNKQRVPPRKPARTSKPPPSQFIYVDTETASGASAMSTPKITPNTVSKRTPLSCVKNRSNLRSRSVEKDLCKAQLAIQSFDDQLNPAERTNVPSLHSLMANNEDRVNEPIY